MTEFQPLNDAELDELDRFLSEQAEAERGTLTLGSAHGFFTAEQCGPAPLGFADAIDEVLADAEFANEREERRIRALLGRMWLEIEADLNMAEEFLPLLFVAEDEDGQPFTLYEDWVLGFMDAVDSSEPWQEALAGEPVTDDPERDAPLRLALEPIVTLCYRAIHDAQEAGGIEADEQDLPPMVREEIAALTPERIEELIDSLGAAVLLIDSLNGPARDDAGYASGQTPIRSEKIGRNDPCPCGSGKKYKKCCGAAANDD
ncbi:UPF0149 family protein [Plasticicumulans acidivorans]|uniref:YecA family protein n=1 Tax=Plasticicumulans acidivorans TaxID=886464 RepID=A0A317MT87_9GAMM|nr:UPF0149 family protein [Plasticicumulans acidivorans]PWV59528.1 uncharacterized protein C7443_11073 [Plasticicumulans acidivorans]